MHHGGMEHNKQHIDIDSLYFGQSGDGWYVEADLRPVLDFSEEYEGGDFEVDETSQANMIVGLGLTKSYPSVTVEYGPAEIVVNTDSENIAQEIYESIQALYHEPAVYGDLERQYENGPDLAQQPPQPPPSTLTPVWDSMNEYELMMGALNEQVERMSAADGGAVPTVDDVIDVTVMTARLIELVEHNQRSVEKALEQIVEILNVQVTSNVMTTGAIQDLQAIAESIDDRLHEVEMGDDL